jgi:hypothetical protein
MYLGNAELEKLYGTAADVAALGAHNAMTSQAKRLFLIARA